MVQPQISRWVENLRGEIVMEQPITVTTDRSGQYPRIRSLMIDRRKKAAGVSIPPGLVRRV